MGAIFRTSDAVGVKHIYLCGITPDAHSPKVQKTALSSSASVPSSHHWKVSEVVSMLKDDDYEIIAVEKTRGAKTYYDVSYSKKTCLVLGNEVEGVQKTTRKMCDRIVSIPMVGKKESLNVSIAYSLVAYEIFQQKK